MTIDVFRSWFDELKRLVPKENLTADRGAGQGLHLTDFV